jgi:hypothetical protein
LQSVRISFTHLATDLVFQVSEFTLSDTPQSTATTSLLRSLCHADDAVVIGTSLTDAEEADLEEQLLANSAAGSGALEHDPCSLFRKTAKGDLFHI